ncbi:MAG: SAM-dependent chlorinase/fluorinase [Limnochordaceae bacterium]|uniref:SAM-dependent chlorinase/fluorinase n=1 Tax=Carboxydichorda subterranea TaxID=3109565 RepID=A0ABZ1BY71_9FIRM|nr:SAM-dependent chlorinase/fluorinase [Limnochorda sp. L945t]MBE3599091.1 SAM-dependent chlorinase/fluorinase [Limnochordaceae bacterium]WRP17663.1 SAM-dependent chlorinase/fluorinase [Limnochorda sp. L945t]
MALPAVPLIALLTDFGEGEYAGVVKAVMASLWPQARFIDLCHTVRPHDVREGAWLLRTTYRYFPDGTLFLAVVDPGVGTARPAIAVESRRYRWVGPDNGLLYPAVEDDGAVRVVQLRVPVEASSTFHGRDVFAPVAARWAAGTPIEQLGSVRASPRLVPLQFYREGSCGEIVRVDRFGNLVTPLEPPPGLSPPGRAVVTLLSKRRAFVAASPPIEARWVGTYGDAAPGQWVVLVGSSGTLEVARVQASAAAMLDAEAGDRLCIRLAPETRT